MPHIIRFGQGVLKIKAKMCAGPAFLTTLYVRGHSVCLSVRLSVRHTRDPRLNGSRCRNTFYTIRQSDGSSLLTPNFVVLSLGVHPEQCVKEGYLPVGSENLSNNLQ